jgi:hypothetical protein
MGLAIWGAGMGPDWRATAFTIGLFAHSTALQALLSANVRHRVYLLAFATLYAGFAITRRRSERAVLLSRRRLVGVAGALALFALTLVAGQHARLFHQWQTALWGLDCETQPWDASDDTRVEDRSWLAGAAGRQRAGDSAARAHFNRCRVR